MSCRNFEQHIYLYDELSENERRLLDAHLQTCESCATLLKELKGIQLLVKQVAGEEIIPQNAAHLTSSIMSKIISEKRQRNSVLDFVFWWRTKIVLTALSIFLLGSFSFEFLRDSTHLKNTHGLFINNSVVLSSKIFRDNFSQGKVRHSLFADCRSTTGESYLNCLRSKLK